MSAHPAPSDRNAAFAGLIFGIIALAIVVFTVSKLTSSKYAEHEEAASTASALR